MTQNFQTWSDPKWLPKIGGTNLFNRNTQACKKINISTTEIKGKDVKMLDIFTRYFPITKNIILNEFMYSLIYKYIF